VTAPSREAARAALLQLRESVSSTDLQEFVDGVINANASTNEGFTVGVFIDFQSALDMMWQSGLLLSLRNLGITNFASASEVTTLWRFTNMLIIY